MEKDSGFVTILSLFSGGDDETCTRVPTQDHQAFYVCRLVCSVTQQPNGQRLLRQDCRGLLQAYNHLQVAIRNV